MTRHAIALAARTEDAYSADAYTNGEWAKAAAMLLDRGYSEAEAEAILRSKWTRWARDAAGTYEGTAADLAAVLDDPKNKCGGPGSHSVKGLL
jgi:hypothetical protein